MLPSLSSLTNRWVALSSAARREGLRRDVLSVALVASPHVAALGLMTWVEYSHAQRAAFLLAWGILNFFWLALLRRPGVAGALSLVFVVVLSVLSQLKFSVLWITANFVDVMVIDSDTISFLFTIFPGLTRTVLLATAVVIPVLLLVWRFDVFRVRRLVALACLGLSAAGLTALERTFPLEQYEGFYGGAYLSHFARSGVDAVSEYLVRGYMESDAVVTERLKAAPQTTCQPTRKPPHIILVHDESSFDIRSAPGIKVPPGYGTHFQSFDGKARRFIVEGAGGPSWYTEYNVLAGLSSRSFGKFAYFVTRLAANRVARGLPNALRNCGYQTVSLYPALGAFMSARSFQTTMGFQRFLDAAALGAKEVEPDRFFYEAALKIIERDRAQAPMFVFVYLAANHFPWDNRWRPDLAPEWKDLGNAPVVDEYLRRQTMSFQDYSDFVGRLRRDFPGEPFLIVRYGDHQPDFASTILDPSLDQAGVAERLMAYDPKYFSTYYAIDAINFKPADVTSALDSLEAAYLPLVVQESAGLPLDPSFTEQKRILERCRGLFYACSDGAEVRRFNRLLIEAGLIRRL